ncbi:aldo/keto reductase [Leucobacter tenebrionis]|uniref:aldo/keto reductase n=1 Tax=Leucobacter tenebrionis TaxID=2873270 RepID=UPI001CA6809B|nr:aldo/keto reductase [Leucobacter tenebrionis]QZY50921.1 aldo/keto reductase [Leucobacter tenebrionis]
MDIASKNRVGRTGVEVTTLGFGATLIGNFMQPLTDAEARAMVDQAWGLGVRYFDTAALYGHGLSEYRLGHALYERPRDAYSLLTKVGRVLKPAARGTFDSGLWVDPAPMSVTYDYSYDGIMRSAEDAMQRLMTDHIEMVLVHDVDAYTHGAEAQRGYFEQAVTDGFRALEKLRDEGVVQAIGFGVNESDVLLEAMQRTDSDVLLLAGRYTLLEQDPIDDLFPLCRERGASVILGGVYNSGILATGPRDGAKFNYSPAPREVLDRAARLETICRRYDIPLAAAALQFAAAHPVVASVCIGSRRPEQQAQTAEYASLAVPSALWEEMQAEGLIREDAPLPGDERSAS